VAERVVVDSSAHVARNAASVRWRLNDLVLVNRHGRHGAHAGGDAATPRPGRPGDPATPERDPLLGDPNIVV